MQDAAREVELMGAAMGKALKETQDEHNVEVEFYKMKLKEAEETRRIAEEKRADAEARRQRAISQAQLTRQGCVYVISNIGSFGPDVFKIGMTRRPNRKERVEELSNASVPFPFDVQMMAECDDAPSFENAIHRELHKQRMNKTRAASRKEFFGFNLDSVRRIVESMNGNVTEFNALPTAEQWNESKDMPDDIAEVYEQAAQAVMADAGASVGDKSNAGRRANQRGIVNRYEHRVSQSLSVEPHRVTLTPPARAMRGEADFGIHSGRRSSLPE